MPALVNQTVTIVNKSGKIVSTSKHIVNVFNEAKSAYNERKAEIRAARKSEQDAKVKEREARKQLEALALEDKDDTRSHRSHRSSRRGSDDGKSVSRSHTTRTRRPPVERGVSDSFYANDGRPGRASHQPSGLRTVRRASDDEPRVGELTRRHTDGMELRRQRSPPRRRASYDDVDMDLAYGELPPPLPERKYVDEVELRSKMSYLQQLLDEGNCVQHSVTAMIDNLQKNPDALAAVALTLAEISNIAAKMAPGALTAMKGSFPAIMALLASPQFAIAAGVGVGVTIIAFGGYKIIKKIKARNSEAGLLEAAPGDGDERRADSPVEEMDTLRELSRIEKWRRGIADEQATSAGTSVDGEFITPAATRTLIEGGQLTEADLKPRDGRSERGEKKHRKKTPKSEVSSSSKSKRSKKSKEKEPGVLRSLFQGHLGSKRGMEHV